MMSEDKSRDRKTGKTENPCDSRKGRKCEAVCPECGRPCISRTHAEWKHECPEGHRWWMKYCYSL